MAYRIFTGIFIVLGIIGIIRTLTDRDGKTFNLVGLRKEQYIVINREKFNNIMRNSGVFSFMWILAVGLFSVVSKDFQLIVLVGLSIFINMIFSKKAKKYIRVK